MSHAKWSSLMPLVLLAVPASASIFIGDTATFDASVRIIGANGVGTGTVIDMSQNGDLLTLCILTADHVLRDNPFQELGIGSQAGIAAGVDVPRNDTEGFETGGMWITTVLGGATGTEDIGKLGITVDLSTLTAAERARILDITPVPMGVGGFNVFDAFGFGDSARPATAAELAFFGQPAGTYTHHSPAPDDEQYGIERTWTNRIDTFNTTFNSGIYTYDAAEFFFSGGRGYGLSGDSGSGMMRAGHVDYVFTFADSEFWKIVAGRPEACDPEVEACPFEFVQPDMLGGGVALSLDDATWFSDAACTPEPATLLLFPAGLALLWWRKRA
jgi:hypothetical protein